MILAHLGKHWRARRQQYKLFSWLLCILRSLRVLLYYRQHRVLCALDVVRHYVAAAPHDDLFHHLSHRDYLVKDLSVRDRVACVLTHYRFEEACFGSGYKRAVYLDGGLMLWQRALRGSDFRITLAMGSRMNAEGDLIIVFLANGKCLHRLSFSWIEGRMAGLSCAIVPFIARNQGRWIDSDAAVAAFEAAFPHNSPSFFCFAALQGMVQALGMAQVVGIKSTAHVAYDPRSVKHFANAYDGFWKALGGIETAGHGHLIALPFHAKPLSELPARHRKRAAGRREHWREIGEAARLRIQGSLRHAPAERTQPLPVAEPLEA